MTPEDALASLESAAERLREVAASLSAAAKPLSDALAQGEKERKEMAASFEQSKKELTSALEKTKSDLADTKGGLVETEKELASVNSALEKVESSILKMIAAATHALHDPDVPLKGRQRMLGLAKLTFAELSSSGFEVIIPEVGTPVDPSRHSVKGRAKSHHDGTTVADVVSWGYRFPSGSGKTAEILVGDASLAPVAEEPLPEEPSEKEGIKMIVEEAPEPPKEKARAKPKKEPTTMFEKLAEAAEQNVQDK